MNTFKKLIFGLLLSGMAFTVACGDNTGDKIQEGQACESKDACDTGLKCVIDAKGKAKGLCKVECTMQNATSKCTKTGAKACVKTMEHGASAASIMTCGADAGGGTVVGAAELGAPCNTAGTDAAKTCKGDALTCYMDKCYAKCTSTTTTDNAGECAGKKSGADTSADATTCKVDGDTKVCVAPTPAAGDAMAEEGQPCKDPADASATAAEKCKENLICVKITAAPGEPQKCAIKCEHPDTKDTACTSSTLGNKCTSGATVEVPGDAPVSVCYGKMPGTLGEDCSATEPCDATHFCHTDNKCWVKCDAAGDNTKCSAAKKGDDTDVDAPTCTASGSGFICSA